mgnify:FL=1|jgi:hypothetical protein|nr:MAG TPA: hypothetical protein [Caudoviricetes sp.]
MKYFTTDDTALAAYLYLCGMEFVQATVYLDEFHRRKSYIIKDEPDRKRHEEDFYLRKTAVPPLDYNDARVRVSRFLRNTVDDITSVL